MRDDQELKGLGGWLILVGIGVVLAPVRMLVSLVPIYKPIFENGTWEAITSANSAHYNPRLAALIVGEIAINALIFVGSLFLIYLYFSKHRLFPKMYIALVAATLIFIPLDAWVASKFLVNQPAFDPETAKEFTRAIVAAVIWVPYMLVSKRVRLTFVEPAEEIEPSTFYAPNEFSGANDRR